MILKITHRTTLAYSSPVVENLTEVRLAPRSDSTQTLKNFDLHVAPATRVQFFRDFLDNSVHCFCVRQPHDVLDMTAVSVVLTHPPEVEPNKLRDVWPLPDLSHEYNVADYLLFRGPVKWHPVLRELIATLAPVEGEPVADILTRLCDLAPGWFAYQKNITDATTTVPEFIQIGAGVCQDFAHLALTILRKLGIPGRYVSGYVWRQKLKIGAAESHAWIEAYLPSIGWVGLDPTARCWADETFVKVAHGRDYTDVPPNRGVFRGKQVNEHMDVAVLVEPIDVLPDNAFFSRVESIALPLQPSQPRISAQRQQQRAMDQQIEQASALRARQQQQQQQQQQQ